MKIRILTLAAFLFGLTAAAQVEVLDRPDPVKVGTVLTTGKFTAALTYLVAEGDTTYTLTYDNAEYKHVTDLRSITFSEDGGALDALYNAIMTVFSEENIKNKDYRIELKVGNQVVAIHNYRMMGVTSAMIFGDRGYFFLSKKQVNKLFGR